MRTGLGILAAACISLFSAWATAQTPADEETSKISLSVPSRAPLRLYLTKRVSKRLGAPVEAKLLEPVYAFDREGVPAGTVVRGEVARVHPVRKLQRALAIWNGDFTPLRSAEVEFNTLILPDGRNISTHTEGTVGLNSFYTEPSKKKKKDQQKKDQK